LKKQLTFLNKNGTICIFPEGTSHDRTDFIKLKAGIAMMALDAMVDWKKKTGEYKNVKILPVGLNYFKREEFRSEVIIEFGKAFVVPSEWSDEYLVNKRETSEKLLKEVEFQMKSVVSLRAPTYEELRAILLLRKIYIPKEVKLSPVQHAELCKRFAKGYDKLKETEETKQKIKIINDYIREIDEIGMTDSEIKNIEFKQSKMKRKFLFSVLMFFISLVFIFPGVVIFLPFVFYIQKKAEKERILAKEKNKNKIEGLDVVSSVKVMQFILCLPFIFLMWQIFFYWFSGRYLGFLHAFMVESMFSKLLVGSLCFPVYLYFCCLVFDYMNFCFRTCYSRTIFFFFKDKLTRLKQDRLELGETIKAFVNKHAIEVDPEYDRNRIIAKENIDIALDDLTYLEKRARRPTNEHLRRELHLVFNDKESS